MENKSQIDVQYYIRMFLRRKLFFIIPCALIIILSIMAGFTLPKTYEAKAVILVEEEKILNPLLRNLAVSTTVSERLQKLREEILSWPRLLYLVETLNLNKDVQNPLELEGLIESVREHIILSMRGNDIITISYRDKDPRITQDVVTTLCDTIIKKNIHSQSEEADSAIKFIETQLTIYKEKLEGSEDALREFKETYGLQMPLAVQINDELAQLEAELTRALVDCTEEHPRVKELRRRISSLKEKRLQQIKQTASNLNAKDFKDYVTIADSIPKQEQELARLTRDREVNEQIYAMLLERLETARISKQLDSSETKTKFRIVEPARLPLKPVKPNKLKISFLGLLLGGMVGFGFVYMLEYTDTSFKNTAGLKSVFGIPVLGSISKILTEEEFEKKQKRVTAAILVTFFLLLLGVVFTIVFFVYREQLLTFKDTAGEKIQNFINAKLRSIRP